MIAGYKDCVSKTDNFSCYGVFVKAPYGHVLPSPVVKETNDFFIYFLDFLQRYQYQY